MSRYTDLKAPDIERFMRFFDDRYYKHEYGQDIRNYMKKIREALKIFEQGDDENVHLYFSAPRGNIEDWADYEETKYWMEQDDPDFTYTRQMFEEEWLSEVPCEMMYYEFHFSAYNEAIGMTLGKRSYIETREDVDYESGYQKLNQYFTWILDQISICAEKIRAGTYGKELNENIPYTMRTGTILRSDLWKIDPSYQNWDQDELTQEEIVLFCGYMKDNRKVFEEGMTSGRFFDCCKIGYQACGYDLWNEKENREMTPKETYLCYADGRDDGLSTIDENSTDELFLWHEGKIGEFNGHHPWEIIRGGNSTHVDFGIAFPIEQPGKTYLYLAGYHRQKEVVKIYLALRKQGIHVYVYEAEDLTQRISGKGKVGIVPNGVLPRYCQSWFPDEHIACFINIHSYEETYEAIAASAKWQKLHYSSLHTDSEESLI